MSNFIKIGLAAVTMGILANMFFGGSLDKEADIQQLIKDGALVVDTRTPGEFSGGHIEGAINIPYDIIIRSIGQYAQDKSQPVIVYCHSGVRSGAAKHALEEAGYSNVINAGGYHRMQKLLAQ